MSNKSPFIYEPNKVFGTRLSEKEQKYLYDNWDKRIERQYGFADFNHNSLKHEVQLTKNNKIKNALQSGLYNIVLLGFGAIFLLFSFNTTNLTGFLLLLLLAVFFMATSLVSIFIELREKWKTSS